MTRKLIAELTGDRARWIALLVMLGLVSFAFWRANFGAYSVVDGDSMYPTFRPADVVQARKVHAESQRGDIVIFADDQGDRFIKRIIGLPGETVTIYGGCVYIDRQRLSEPYLLPHTYTFKSDIKNERPEVWRLEANQYFVLGDNRLGSHDSRNFGPVQRGQIQGVVNLPENAPRPGFCGIIFSQTGKGVTARYSPGRNPARAGQQNSGSKT